MISNRMENMRSTLMSIQKEFADDFQRTAAASREEVMKVLKPGEAAPDTGKIWGKDARAEFETRAAGYRSKASAVIDATAAAIRADMTKAPSTEAVAVINALAARSSVSPEEIDAVLSKYGDNYLAYNAIRDIALSCGCRGVEEHHNTGDLREVQSSKSIVVGMTLTGAEKGYSANPAFLAFQNFMCGGDAEG